MAEYALTATSTEAPAGTFYDRIAGLYDLTFKVNGYGRSLDQYFRDHPPPIFPGAHILDAGCGTGLLTLALLRAISVPVTITALDLSGSSVAKAKKAVTEVRDLGQKVSFTRGNVLSLPFADASFDLIVTSGMLEYLPLEAGLDELARVIAPQGHLLNLPIRPSLASTALGLMFRFKAHPPSEVDEKTRRHFRVVNHYRFPPLQAIGWTKTAVLAQKF
jgi:ubiquinone/menaquinone biosynthesis C-methylase UbiE